MNVDRGSEVERRFLERLGIVLDRNNPAQEFRENETPVSDIRIEHVHDWRKSPMGDYRESRQYGKKYMVRCATCPARGWGREQAGVIEWPKWAGVVEDIEIES